MRLPPVLSIPTGEVVEIKVTVENLEAVDLRTVIGTRTGGSYLGDGDFERHDVPMTLADAVVDKLVEKLAEDERYPSLRDLVQRVRESILREKLEPIIEEAINGEIRLTNEYGEPKGKATTLREYIVEEAKKLITRARRNARGGYDSLLQEVVDNKVRAALTNELKGVLQDEKQKVKELVQAHSANLMAEALTNAAEAIKPVRSATRPVRDTPQA